MQQWFGVPLPDEEELKNLTAGGSVMDFPDGVPQLHPLINMRVALETELEDMISRFSLLK